MLPTLVRMPETIRAALINPGQAFEKSGLLSYGQFGLVLHVTKTSGGTAVGAVFMRAGRPLDEACPSWACGSNDVFVDDFGRHKAT